MGPFRRKLYNRVLVNVAPFGWHSQAFLGTGEWYIGLQAWPDRMSHMDYFALKNGLTVPETMQRTERMD